MDLCLLLPGWIKLSDISSKGVISYSSFFELTRCLYKVKIHQQSLIRNPEEGGAWRKQCFPTFHYLYWIFFHLFSYQHRLGNASETLSSYHCCFCTWEMSDLEPLQSMDTGSTLGFHHGNGHFLHLILEDMKCVPRCYPSYHKIKIYGMIPSETYIPVIGRLDMGKLCLSFFSKIFDRCSWCFRY